MKSIEQQGFHPNYGLSTSVAYHTRAAGTFRAQNAGSTQ